MNTTGRGDGGDGGPENRGRNITKFGDAPAYRYLDYNLDPDGWPVELSWNQLGTRLRAVAARPQQVTTPGDRVAILAPQGVDYVIGFFAAVAAATIAVPLFAPELPGRAERLDAVLGDAEPTVVLTTTQAAQSVQEFLHKLPRRRRPRVVAIDAVPDSVGTTFVPPAARGADDIAYLQDSGRVARSQWAAIVDPETDAELPTGRSAKSGCTATTSAAATGAAHAKPTWHSTTRCSRGCTAAATPRARRPAPAGSAPSPSGPPARARPIRLPSSRRSVPRCRGGTRCRLPTCDWSPRALFRAPRAGNWLAGPAAPSI